MADMLTAALVATALAQTASINVFVVSYFPVDGDQIDKTVTHDVGGPYADLKSKTEKLTKEACEALEKGSTFRGYKLDTKPSLRYNVVGQAEFKEAIPLRPKKGDDAPLPDYSAIMKRINAKNLVENKGVSEVWLWGYHGKIGLWESNMSSPTGDISNSDRDEKDLPVFNRTYTVYHYNYGRGLGEMLENHMHQFEHLLNYADGRD
nr:hypothetical protein [Armatimonadota bacterium]